MFKSNSPMFSGSSAPYTPPPLIHRGRQRIHHCTSCGTKLEVNFRHCPGCGVSLTTVSSGKRCGACDAVVGQDDKFCGSCGAKV